MKSFESHERPVSNEQDNRVAVALRERMTALNILANNPDPRAESDARSNLRLWSQQLWTNLLPCLELAYAANGYFNKAQQQREDVQAVETLMQITDASHPAYGDMARGNAKRESDAIHFEKLFADRILAAAELFPPRLDLEVSEYQDTSRLTLADRELVA